MTEPHHLAALVTLLAALILFWTMLRVGAARGRYKVAAPATTGAPEFERAFRAQMNTLEGLALFLPSLWLFAIYWNDRLAAAIGVVWLVGRVLYVLGYAAAAERRELGFLVQMLATVVLLFGALIGVGRAIAATGFM